MAPLEGAASGGGGGQLFLCKKMEDGMREDSRLQWQGYESSYLMAYVYFFSFIDFLIHSFFNKYLLGTY